MYSGNLVAFDLQVYIFDVTWAYMLVGVHWGTSRIISIVPNYQLFVNIWYVACQIKYAYEHLIIWFILLYSIWYISMDSSYEFNHIQSGCFPDNGSVYDRNLPVSNHNKTSERLTRM